MSAHCSGSRPNRAIGDGGVRLMHRAAHTLSAYFRERKRGKTTQLLSRALQDRDLAVRAHAVKLLDVLSKSNDDKIKKQVARVLGTAGGIATRIRLQAIETLGKMEAKFGNKYLHAALRDPNPFVRERVMQVSQRTPGTATRLVALPSLSGSPLPPCGKLLGPWEHAGVAYPSSGSNTHTLQHCHKSVPLFVVHRFYQLYQTWQIAFFTDSIRALKCVYPVGIGKTCSNLRATQCI